MNRRQFFSKAITAGFLAIVSRADAVAGDASMTQPDSAAPQNALTPEQWMEEWMSLRAPGSPLFLGRFREPIYFLLEPITWEPDEPATKRYTRVEVPRGFVTDLASIPPEFFSLLRPDGEYTYSAIVHDYLYWTQPVPRAVADEIFRLGMVEFGIPVITTSAIYNSVRLFGESAWNQNANLRKTGEKRILKKFPPNAKISWREWKTLPDVFL